MNYIDTPTVLIYLFWGFFFALIVYLRREDKREGYPLESDRQNITVQGWPAMPEPRPERAKHPALAGGAAFALRRQRGHSMSINAKPIAPFPGAPLTPTGDPMKAGVGPGSYADRDDRPDLTLAGEPKIQPMSVVDGFTIEKRDPDPRGWPVHGGDGKKAGTVNDIWVDRSEPQVRYYQVELDGGSGSVLLPAGFAKVRRSAGRIDVKAIFAEHFADVPTTAAADRITLLEEDKIVAYYAGGTMYAERSRSEPLF